MGFYKPFYNEEKTKPFLSGKFISFVNCSALEVKCLTGYFGSHELIKFFLLN